MNKRQQKKFDTKLGFRTYKYCQKHRLVKKLKRLMIDIFGSDKVANKFIRFTLQRCEDDPNLELENVLSYIISVFTDYKVALDAEAIFSLHTIMNWLSYDNCLTDMVCKVRGDYVIDRPLIITEKVNKDEE